MTKQYTAQDMRDASLWFYYPPNSTGKAKDFDRIEISAMLRQAADMMERKEREKKYEYAIRYKKGRSECIERMSKTHYESDVLALADACPLVTEETVLVRREVGEWEEVK